MQSYGKFAKLYDRLMQDVPYEQIADKIDAVIQEHSVKNKLVLDLACGTGILTGLLKEKGYDMIGVDLSPEMLQIAKEKHPDILFLNQAMDSFELFGTVGAIVCSLDSFNYLTEDGALERAFHLCNNYLEPGGLLIFDINTEYKFEHVLNDNVFAFDDEDVFYTWENAYFPEEKLCDFYLTFFEKTGEFYTRFDEVHTERSYSDEEIKKMLTSNGFSIKYIYDGFTENPKENSSERAFYVCENVDSIQMKAIK